MSPTGKGLCAEDKLWKVTSHAQYLSVLDLPALTSNPISTKQRKTQLTGYQSRVRCWRSFPQGTCRNSKTSPHLACILRCFSLAFMSVVVPDWPKVSIAGSECQKTVIRNPGGRNDGVCISDPSVQKKDLEFHTCMGYIAKPCLKNWRGVGWERTKEGKPECLLTHLRKHICRNTKISACAAEKHTGASQLATLITRLVIFLIQIMFLKYSVAWWWWHTNLIPVLHRETLF